MQYARIYLFLLSLICLQSEAFSQTTLYKLQFEGIERTDPGYLLRFVQSTSGTPPDSLLIEQDCQRLRNLPFIADANFRIDKNKNGLNLVFVLDEAWTLFPIVNFGGIRGNIWTQLGLTDIHFGGKGIQFTGFYQLTDGRHGGQLYLKMPYLRGSRWGLSLSGLSWASTEPLYFGEESVFYDYNNTSIGGMLHHEFKPDHELSLGGSYFIEQYSKSLRHSNEITPGPEVARIPKLLFKVQHRISRINYHFYHLQGWDLNQYLQSIYDFTYQSWFRIYWADARYFRRLGKEERLNLALRFRAGLSDNEDSPFAPFVLDSHVNIRGSGNRIDRGTGVLVANLELRYAAIEREWFAAQLVAFTDIGSWRQPGGTLGDFIQRENFHDFLGLGFRLIHKKAFNAIVRVDYGIDPFEPERRGLVLGLGQYF